MWVPFTDEHLLKTQMTRTLMVIALAHIFQPKVAFTSVVVLFMKNTLTAVAL